MTSRPGGPLPKVDQNSQLQRASLHALKALLPAERFLVRDERIEDYGVDASIEVLDSGRATNCRATIQIKARSGLRAGADGSYSVRVQRSNLNYLLNGSCPIYILYRPEDGRLWFDFASTHLLGSTTTRSVALLFRRELDDAGIEAIAHAAVTESQRQRRLRDLVAEAASGARVEIANDRVVDADDAERLLANHGIALVSWGHATRVAELCRLLPVARIRASSHLLLVQGYAEFASTRYLDAKGSLREATLRRELLSADDASLLSYLSAVVDCALGEIDEAELDRRLVPWRESAPPQMLAQSALSRAWDELARLPWHEVDAAVNNILAILDNLSGAQMPVPIQQHAELLRSYLEVRNIVTRFLQVLVCARDEVAWQAWFGGQHPRNALHEVKNRLANWYARLASNVDAITRSGNAPLLCRARFVRDSADAYIRVMLQPGRSSQMSRDLIDRIQATEQFAEEVDQPEIALRAALLRSDLLAATGQVDAAASVADRVEKTATILQYADVARLARDAERRRADLAGKHLLEFDERDWDGVMADASDEDLDAMMADVNAGSSQHISRDELIAEREAARMRRDWCRHVMLEPVDDPAARRVRLDRSRHEWSARCGELGVRTALPVADSTAVLATFRRAHCESCSCRAPLLPSGR